MKLTLKKMKREFAREMKNIYAAPTKQAKEAAFDNFVIKWESKYSYAVKNWRNNWEELTFFFEFR